MVNPLVDSRDVKFVLFELLKIDELTSYKEYSDFDKETFESVVELSEKVSVDKFYPEFDETDRIGCTFDPDTKEVLCPEGIKRALRAYYDAGFMGIIESPEIGGMGMPHIIRGAASEYGSAAHQPLLMYPALAHGAMDLILKFGTEEQKSKYVNKMLTGMWGGTMCLTEPDAGSDVGALKAKARKQDDGTYLITGQKIFISAGDNDIYENMIHPVLARIDGDPAGTKGISIFIVPKYFVNDDGSLGEKNDVNCVGIEHKMGLNSCCTCTMSFGDEGKCVGFLLGEERKGMKIMFRMMNDFRMGTAVQAQGVSSAAYMHAVTYAKNRVQGADISQMMNPDAKSVPIVQHPDVARMLLWMKSYVDAQRILIYYMFYNMDILHAGSEDEARDARGIVDLLVPICKAGCSDRNVMITAEAMQVLGGYGFCQDYPVEQMMRNSKILAIFEGANGIQGIDLVMRKILMNPDQHNYRAWRKRVDETIEKARGIVEDKYIEPVSKGMKKLDGAVELLKAQLTEGKVKMVFMNATPFRKAMYMATLAWTHLWSMTLTVPGMKDLTGERKGDDLNSFLDDNSEAAFYYGRVLSAQFFIRDEFPQFFGMIEGIMNTEKAVLKAYRAVFTGAPEE